MRKLEAGEAAGPGLGAVEEPGQSRSMGGRGGKLWGPSCGGQGCLWPPSWLLPKEPGPWVVFSVQ